jgi:hypothetical protein
MSLTPRRLALAVAMTLPGLAQAAPFTLFEARSFGMGGAGVAAAEHAAAALFNPALLAAKSETGSFSFIAPGLGASASGNKGAIDAVTAIDDHQSVDRLTQAADAFQAAYNACSAGGCNNDPALRTASGQVASAAQVVLDDLRGLDGKTYQVAAGGVMAVALPQWEYKGALSLNVEFHGRATPTVAATDLNDAQLVVTGASNYASSGAPAALNTFIDTATGDILVGTSNSDYESNFKVVGVAVADIGVSLAKAFTVADQTLLVGITPKIQQVNTVAYTANVDNVDFDLKQNKKTASGVNLDVGVAKVIEEGPLQDVRLGLVVRNLIPKTYKTSDPTQDVKMAPQLRVGAAWTGRWGTLTSDLDLTANKLVGGGSGSSQIIALGGELNAANIAKLRLGFRQDIKQKLGTLTAGVSLFGVQLSAAYSADREIAAMAQFGLSF